MAKKICIRINGLSFNAEFNESKTARAVYELLPVENYFRTWGDEFYFQIPVDSEWPPEDPTSTVAIGDIAFWVAGNAIAIFFGPTPLSKDNTPVPASPVELIGKLTDDPTLLKSVAKKARIRVEKA